MDLELLERYLDAHIRALGAEPAPGVFTPDSPAPVAFDADPEDPEPPTLVVYYALDSADMFYVDEQDMEAVYAVGCFAGTRVEARTLFQRFAKRLGTAGWNVSATGEGPLAESGWWAFQGAVSADSAST